MKINLFPIQFYYLLVIIFFVPLRSISQGPTYFDIIPGLDSHYVQGQGLMILPDTHEIFIMGDLIDTTIEQGKPVVRPFLAGFDYKGQMIRFHLIYDTIEQSKYSISTRPLVKTDSSILVFLDRVNEEGYFRPNLIEFDLSDEKIINSLIYNLPDEQDLFFRGQWYYQDSSHNIISYHFLNNSDRILIKVVDSTFQIKTSVIVSPNNWINAPKYIEADSDTSFVLIGTSIAPTGGDYPEAKIFLLRVDYDGNILSFKLAPEIIHETVTFTAQNSYTVLKDENNNWIISVVFIDETNCTSCPKAIPFSFCTNYTFDTLRWINYFSGVPVDSNQFFVLTGSDLSGNGSGFVISGIDYALPERNSFLTKISMDGESLWTRNFIHINWEQERIAWANVEDVKSTPHHTYALTGTVYDKQDMIRVPWLLHLDSMGCLIPGCDRIVSTQHMAAPNKYFIIFPNPTANQLYLKYIGHDDGRTPYTVSVTSMDGSMVRTLKVSPQPDIQYIASLEQLPPGHYVITFQNDKGACIQSEKIIKL